MNQKNQLETKIIRFKKNNNILCPQIESLNISFCNLSRVPKIIFCLQHLTQLNLSNNYLKTLPNDIGNLHNLLILNLSGNKLTGLPNSIKYLHNLNSLDLSCNEISDVPKILYGSLGALKILDLSFNKIKDFNYAPQCINNVVVLKLSFNKLINIPKWVFHNLCQLIVLDICGNYVFSDIQINEFYFARVFDTLKFLNIENCRLSCGKTQFLSHFKSLEVLFLGNKNNNAAGNSRNFLGNLKTNELQNFKVLKCLYLQNVHISTLPLGFEYLKNLEILDLSENLLSWLPECICELICLKILHLTSNELLFMPCNIGKLVNLEELHLGNNNLSFLPESFYNLNNLQYVDLYNNKIEEIDFMIFKKKKLKGIDLGLNCLQHNLFDSDNEAVKMQYEYLKNSLRQHFNYSNGRCDLQRHKTPSNDGSYNLNNFNALNYLDAVSDGEDFISATVPQKHFQNDFKEENWEEEIEVIEKDDLFDPNEVRCLIPKLMSFKDGYDYEFRNNYCPAFNHSSSFLETYNRNVIESTSKYTPVDGQFDSD